MRGAVMTVCLFLYTMIRRLGSLKNVQESLNVPISECTISKTRETQHNARLTYTSHTASQ